MPRKIVGLFLIALVLTVSGGTMHAQASLSRDKGLMITRLVNSLEAMSPHINGSVEWSDLSEVMKFAVVGASAGHGGDFASATMVDSSTLIVLDYTLQLTRSDDKKHYQISLTPTVPGDDARLSWFSDDRGLIYTGRGLR
jgi:hypothetical protein